MPTVGIIEEESWLGSYWNVRIATHNGCSILISRIAVARNAIAKTLKSSRTSATITNTEIGNE
jgi:hypothetical protein